MSNRKLSAAEHKAWTEYNNILDKYHELYNIKMYDRPSVHQHFPEIKTAFEKCCKLGKEANKLLETRFKNDA